MKRHAPATARNSEPIAQVLAQELPGRGLVLEIASGSGEHAVFMAQRFPQIDWQPSDPDGEALASIGEWAREAGLTNLKQPVEFDTRTADWPLDAADAVVCINMVHISPWAATEALFEGSARLLAPGAPLVLYGPYFEDDVEPASSNVAFDQSLRSRNPEWGIRNVAQLEELAQRSGFEKTARYEMPANNLTLVYRRT
ncbi:DUF938 domain-containing protein [Qipengyuania sp. 1XM1-15A]|uniref:DUF938 domain-containing protein n=1 Tax=Qipengyuania xiamenensis TaxID=2867237 RepID=UPI001C879B81|nr:DUF938 domain-containing protein [Qipengyuania xiamenensis]MBX7532220.1 DUF938 domain-containing protein [Qipengyuania xiamenensis]